MRERLLALLCGASLVMVGAVVVAGPADAATPTCRGLAATIVGTTGDDDLDGTLLADVVWLGPGNDTFHGSAGDDVVCGGTGNDAIFGGYGNDTVNGEGGADRLAGDPGNDHLIGSTGADALYGGADDDRIDGGRDKDLLTYVTALHPITVDGAAGTVDGDGHDVYLGIETLQGTADADTMVGGPASESFVGVAGDDTISGNGGNDTLVAGGGTASGGDGNDLVVMKRGTARGDAGIDTIQLSHGARGLGGVGDDLFRLRDGVSTAYGEAGDDMFVVRSRAARPAVLGGVGDDSLSFQGFARAVRIGLGRGEARWGTSGLVTVRSVNLAYGTAYADVVSGTAGNDYLFGGGGGDRLHGLGGTDILEGGKGRDIGYGGAGGDICSTEVRRGCEV